MLIVKYLYVRLQVTQYHSRDFFTSFDYYPMLSNQIQYYYELGFRTDYKHHSITSENSMHLIDRCFNANLCA